MPCWSDDDSSGRSSLLLAARAGRLVEPALVKLLGLEDFGTSAGLVVAADEGSGAASCRGCLCLGEVGVEEGAAVASAGKVLKQQLCLRGA